MSVTSKQLERALRELIKSNDELRAALSRYSKSAAKLADRIGQDAVLIEALEAVGGEPVREDMNRALANQEAARRQVRVAMSKLAVEQGSSPSELARSLGVSRQLVSRLLSRSLPASP